MKFARINDAYEFASVLIDVEDLFLDPANPRIAVEVMLEPRLNGLTEAEFLKPNNQELIHEIINENFQIDELVDAISVSGFSAGSNDIVVKEVKGNREKYIVLEGNRRLTALRNILDDPHADPELQTSVESIHVKKLVYKNNKNFTETEVVDYLLDIIHITGPLRWGPIQEAAAITRSLARILNDGPTQFSTPFNSSKFNAAAQRIANRQSGQTTKGIKKEVTIWRVFEQLLNSGYDAKASHYTLIKMSIEARDLKDEYFELDPETLWFSELGLHRFANLIIEVPHVVQNPQLFRKLVTCYRTGPKFLLQVENAETLSDVELAHEAAKSANSQNRHLTILEDAIRKLIKIEHTDFDDTVKERQLVSQLLQIAKNFNHLLKN
jgi:hypothetical protein